MQTLPPLYTEFCAFAAILTVLDKVARGNPEILIEWESCYSLGKCSQGNRVEEKRTQANMKNLLLDSIIALALMAASVMANPIIKADDVANSSFHPAKSHSDMPGVVQGFETGKRHSDLGFGAALIPQAVMTPGHPDAGPVPNLPTVPEPSALVLFGIFFMTLWLRSRWATWHR